MNHTDFYTAREAADRLGISLSHLYEMARTGRLDNFGALRLGRKVRFNAEIFDAAWPTRKAA